jgi:hypothetical protein
LSEIASELLVCVTSQKIGLCSKVREKLLAEAKCRLRKRAVQPTNQPTATEELQLFFPLIMIWHHRVIDTISQPLLQHNCRRKSRANHVKNTAYLHSEGCAQESIYSRETQILGGHHGKKRQNWDKSH